MWDRRALDIGDHDGDTVNVILDQGFGDTKQITLRLLGVFAPELKEPGGVECREFVANWFDIRRSPKSKWNCVVTTARMKVADHEQTTLGRYVGTVTSLDGTDNLNLEIIQFIAARGYGGGTGSKITLEELTARQMSDANVVSNALGFADWGGCVTSVDVSGSAMGGRGGYGGIVSQGGSKGSGSLAREAARAIHATTGTENSDWTPGPLYP